MADPKTERAAIISRAVEIRANIQQLFDDAAHWNRVHTPWKKAINPDPDGRLLRIVAGIDRMLANEARIAAQPQAQPE